MKIIPIEALDNESLYDETVKKDIERMKIILNELIPAADAYYNSGDEIMSNKEYDGLYNELLKLEETTGFTCEESPTQNVGAIVVDELPKAKHEYAALSLDKTKDVDEYIKKFEKYITEAKANNYGNNDNVVLMWKMDGSTVQATYDDGKLTSLVTRGNGETGSVITHNARYIDGLPTKIGFKGHLVVRGEAVMSYDEFERINKELDEGEQYKNPRNLANATISMLDSREMRKRAICFKAFNLIHMDHFENETFKNCLHELSSQGFSIVPHALVPISKLRDEITSWTQAVELYEFPVDGLVCVMDNQSYAKTLSGTGHHPHIMNGYAFKWTDETAETIVRDIFWSPSRTGLFNPVAIFDPVELCGTTVERASLHNVSYVVDKDIKVGDRVTVYKANMIIPQIDENLDAKQTLLWGKERYSIPEKCPICHTALDVSTDENTGTIVLRCPNEDCGAKQIGSLVHFCERDCMDIRGMSEETIIKLVEAGCISEYADFYTLEQHEKIANIPGLGEKSWRNMIKAAEKSAQGVSFIQFIHSLGIPNIGKGQAKLLYGHYKELHRINKFDLRSEKNYVEMLISDAKQNFDFTCIDGIGPVMSNALHTWADNDNVMTKVTNVLALLDFKATPDFDGANTASGGAISGKTFVITGKLETFTNRDELVAEIESLGGKVAGSVSKNTDYLINNDVTSTSGKNKKAKELGIPIISEEEVEDMKNNLFGFKDHD